ERDREVEAGAFLLEPGRREVHRDVAGGPEELGRRDRAPNTVLRLLARAVGEPDDRERRVAELDVRLHLDPAGVESDEGVGEHPCEHGSIEAAAGSRVCDGTATIYR